jgi:hypothetical protein
VVVQVLVLGELAGCQAVHLPGCQRRQRRCLLPARLVMRRGGALRHGQVQRQPPVPGRQLRARQVLPAAGAQVEAAPGPARGTQRLQRVVLAEQRGGCGGRAGAGACQVEAPPVLLLRRLQARRGQLLG